MRQLQHKCQLADTDSCQKLRRLMQQQPDLDADLDRSAGADGAFNGDLVRSLDRRSSKRRQRRKHHGKRRKDESEEELESRRERRTKKRQEKEERRRRRKERREKRRLLKQQRRKERRAKKVAASQRHSVSVRSVAEASPKCQFKLVDSCTWPHCNPTCPKLKNPETGESNNPFASVQKSCFYWCPIHIE
jgi:hypothetical protein